jgi:branched-chain amino acid transport system ATP-binding protein
VAEALCLDARQLAVSYGRVQALQAIDLQIPARGLLLVLGPNGAGKTSLLKALAGAVACRGASVRLNGVELASGSAQQRVKAGIALVPEGRGRLPGLSVKDNLLLAWHAASAHRREPREAAIDGALSLFPILKQRFEQESSTLSGGEMQMLAIARALLSKPDLLLLDEPSLGLAPMATARVYEALAGLNARGLAMIVVEQKAVPLPAARESTLVLRNGRRIFQAERRPTVDELASLYLGAKAA